MRSPKNLRPGDRAPGYPGVHPGVTLRRRRLNSHRRPNLTALPPALAAHVGAFMAAWGVDFMDAASVRNECETWSLRLAAAIHGLAIVDEDGAVVGRIRCGVDLLWPNGPPAVLADDPLAIGHVVVFVVFDGEDFMIDLTAAQFPVLGWTGPRARPL